MHTASSPNCLAPLHPNILLRVPNRTHCILLVPLHPKPRRLGGLQRALAMPPARKPRSAAVALYCRPDRQRLRAVSQTRRQPGQLAFKVLVRVVAQVVVGLKHVLGLLVRIKRELLRARQPQHRPFKVPCERRRANPGLPLLKAQTFTTVPSKPLQLATLERAFSQGTPWCRSQQRRCHRQTMARPQQAAQRSAGTCS
jgi:hypothetical protein